MIWFLLRDCRSWPAEEAQPAGLMRRCAGTTLRLHDTDTETFAPSADALTVGPWRPGIVVFWSLAITMSCPGSPERGAHESSNFCDGVVNWFVAGPSPTPARQLSDRAGSRTHGGARQGSREATVASRPDRLR